MIRRPHPRAVPRCPRPVLRGRWSLLATAQPTNLVVALGHVNVNGPLGSAAEVIHARRHEVREHASKVATGAIADHRRVPHLLHLTRGTVAGDIGGAQHHPPRVRGPRSHYWG